MSDKVEINHDALAKAGMTAQEFSDSLHQLGAALREDTFWENFLGMYSQTIDYIVVSDGERLIVRDAPDAIPLSDTEYVGILDDMEE